MSAASDIADTPRRKETAVTKTVQFQRFVAAGIVVLAHVSLYFHHCVDPDVRILREVAQGMALFFVISGVIMVITANPHV